MNRLVMLVTACSLAALSMGGGCGSVIEPDAEKQLRARRGAMSVTVFPAFLRTGGQPQYDDAAAAMLGAAIEDARLATAIVTDVRVPLSGRPGFNQAKMLRESLAEFADWVRANPIPTDYAVLPEYLIDGRGRALGVHLYVVTPDGRCAYALLLNAHHEPFRRICPQNAADCTRILIDVMRDELAVKEGER